MKGIAHFAVGVATASLFPQAVQAGAEGNPLYFILGGVCGLLPDTLDFKLYRFFFRHDVEVQPDPLKPDPSELACAVAAAVTEAYVTRKPYRIKLNTVRLGPDSWQRYHVEFDARRKRVVVRYGPVVDTGGKPEEGALMCGPSADAALPCGIQLDYTAELTIDAFDGPLLEMQPLADGRVVPAFIPWHRQWTHSFVVGLAPALLATAIWGPLAGLVGLLAYAAHIGVDQLGYMGSNLFYPFQKRRRRGLGLVHSGAAGANFSAVWLSCLLIFWNLSNAVPGGRVPVNLAKLLCFGALLPFAVHRLIRRIWRRRALP